MKTQLIPKFEKRALKILKCSMLTVIDNSWLHNIEAHVGTGCQMVNH